MLFLILSLPFIKDTFSCSNILSGSSWKIRLRKAILEEGFSLSNVARISQMYCVSDNGCEVSG